MNREQRRKKHRLRKAVLAAMVAGALASGAVDDLYAYASAPGGDLLIQGGGGGSHGCEGIPIGAGGGGGGYILYEGAQTLFVFGGGGDGETLPPPHTDAGGGGGGIGGGADGALTPGGAGGAFPGGAPAGGGGAGDGAGVHPGGNGIANVGGQGAPADLTHVAQLQALLGGEVRVDRGMTHDRNAVPRIQPHGGLAGVSIGEGDADNFLTLNKLTLISGETGFDMGGFFGTGGNALFYNDGKIDARRIELFQNYHSYAALPPAAGQVVFYPGTLVARQNYVVEMTGDPNIGINGFEFDLTGVAAGGTVLTVTGGGIPVDNAGSIHISGTTGLSPGEEVTLIDNARGGTLRADLQISSETGRAFYPRATMMSPATLVATALDITVQPASLSFGSVEVGYGAVNAQATTITNDTAVSIEASISLQRGSSSPFEITTGGETVEIGGVYPTGHTVAVRPKTGLDAGTYTDYLVFSMVQGGRSFSLDVPLSFTVPAVGSDQGRGPGAPQTGDLRTMIFPILLATVGAIGLGGWYLYSKRAKKKVGD